MILVVVAIFVYFEDDLAGLWHPVKSLLPG